MSRGLPAALPPAERTVGQVVAETIRLYGANFWRAVPLGLPLAALDELTFHHGRGTQAILFVVAAPFLSFAYARAAALAARITPSLARLAMATLVGTVVLIPAALILASFWLLAVAYLALVGLAVPVVVIEGKGFLASLRRAGELGRADYVHALGSLAALAVVFGISRYTLVALLQGQANNAVRVAVFLADVVLAPLLVLGAALLYFDQVARVGSKRPRRRSRRDADLHPPVDPHAAGRPDAQDQS